MAVKIRLRRVGAKKQPAYRIVIADARAPRDGRFIETIGYYNPLTRPETVVVDSERALYWLRHGAQATDVVKHMLVREGIWSAYTGEPMPEYVKPVVQPEELPAPEETAAAAPEETEAAGVEAPMGDEAASGEEVDVAAPVEEAASDAEAAKEEAPAE